MNEMRDETQREFLRDRLTGKSTEQGSSEAQPQRFQGAADHSELERAAMIETAIQQAIRQGEFDDLPGAGKPLEGLDGKRDPDWWIRRKIESEKLSGLGPPAIMLRNEDAGLNDQLDGMGREADVRSVIEDFNKRVIDARRQLLGGPPVVTRTRDVEEEVATWRARREQRRTAAAAQTAEQEQTGSPESKSRRWFRRKKR